MASDEDSRGPRKRRWLVVVLGFGTAALIMSGCDSSGGKKTGPTAPPSDSSTTATAPSTAGSSGHQTTSETASSATDNATDGGTDGAFPMPNEVGQILQDAQDDIQRVSGNPTFISHSHDLRGHRLQIMDRDWQVCTQNIAPNKRVPANGRIDLGVVKVSESCP
jgi:hypothetical protein